MSTHPPSDTGEPGIGGRRSLRDVYRRSWELELLLSGAVLVALIQLPSVVDRVYDRVDPQLAGGWRMTAFMAYYYVKLILYTLLAGFLIHLCSRAYWVSLIGLGTAFPRGIRWDRSRLGPNALRVYREELPGIRQLIVAADRFSSAVFAGAVTVVVVFAVSIIIGAVAGTLAFISARTVPAVPGELVFWTTYLVIALAPSLAASIDRSRGDRWSPESRAARAVRTTVRAFLRLTIAPVHGTPTYTIATNVSRTALWIGGTAVMIALLALFIVNDVMGRSRTLSADSYVHFPDAAAGGLVVDPAYYESMRQSDDVHASTPSIPAPVVEGDYLPLFVPVTARRANEAIESNCPDAPRFHRHGVRLRSTDLVGADSARAVLDCLVALLQPRLDGAPLDADFRFHRHPTTGVRGLIAYVPLAGLAAGAHTLEIARWPRATDDEPRPPHQIPFWR